MCIFDDQFFRATWNATSSLLMNVDCWLFHKWWIKTRNAEQKDNKTAVNVKVLGEDEYLAEIEYWKKNRDKL